MSIWTAAPDILILCDNYSGEQEKGSERKDHLLNNRGKMGMSHEMLIIRTVATIVDMQKVINIWQHEDTVSQMRDKILRQKSAASKSNKNIQHLHFCLLPFFLKS